MSPERTSPHNMEGFTTRLSRFDAARSERNKRRAAEELLRFGLEENWDSVSMLRVLGKGLSASISQDPVDRQGGEIIVDGVGSYLSNLGIVFKWYTQPEANQETERNELASLLESAQRNIRTARMHDTPPPTLLSGIVEKIRLGMQTQGNNNVLVINSSPELNRQTDTGRVNVTAYTEAFRNTRSSLADTSADGDFRAAEKILEIAESMPEGRLNILDRAIGDTSLREIFTAGDIDSGGMQLLQFIRDLPKGDLFWEGILHSVFLRPQAVSPLTREDYQHPDVSEKVFLLQRWLAVKLFDPVFFPEQKDPRFNRLLGETLPQMDPASLRTFGAMIAQTMLHMTDGFRTFRPEIPSTETIDYSRIATLATSQFTEMYGMYLSIIDQDVHNFLTNNRNLIVHEWRRRFFTVSQHLMHVVEGFDMSVVESNYEERHTRAFLTQVEEYLGPNFLERLNTQKDQLQELTHLVGSKVFQERDASYWPHTDVAHTIEFTPKSLPDIIGLEAINFAFGHSIEKPTLFMIRTKGDIRSVSIKGEIDPSGHVINWSADLEEAAPGLKAFLEYIAVSSFHDLVIRGLIDSGSSHQQIHPLSPTDEDATDDEERHSSRPLPRNLRQTHGGSPRHQVTTSQALVERIQESQEERGFTPRKVDMYKTKLPGYRQYLQALGPYVFWQYQPGERDNVIANIREARRRMYKPNSEKLRKIPPEFNLWHFKEPIDGEEVYMENWVVQHTSPKLTEEEERSLVLHYQKHYMEGSSLSFLDYLRTWITNPEPAS